MLNVASGSLPLPRRFARYARSSTCGERDHLSHVVGDPGVVLLGMSRQIAPQTRSKALRRTKRVLDARQGMEGAKNAYRGSQEVKRADTPNQGLSGRQEPRQPPAKPICTEQAAMRLVGGRRPSVLQRWGVWGSPQTVSGSAQGAAGTVAARFFLENGEQKHAKDFEAAKEQCRIDNHGQNVNT